MTKPKASANTRKTPNKGKPFTKNDPRINRAGRPKDGESWGAVMKVLGNMTSDELAEMVGGRSTDLGRQFMQMPKGVQMKYLIILRSFASLMFEPGSSMLENIVSRVEGKVPDSINMNGKGEVVFRVVHDDDERLQNPSPEPVSPEAAGGPAQYGEAQGAGMGTPGGEDQD